MLLINAIIGSGGTLSGGSDDSHVIGPMDYVIVGTSETTLPVGDGARYRPVYITPVSGGSTYTAEFKNSAYPTGTNCVSGSITLDHVAPEIYWDIDNNGGSDATVDWVDITMGVDVPADMRLSIGMELLGKQLVMIGQVQHLQVKLLV